MNLPQFLVGEGIQGVLCAFNLPFHVAGEAGHPLLVRPQPQELQHAARFPDGVFPQLLVVHREEALAVLLQGKAGRPQPFLYATLTEVMKLCGE